MPSNIGSQPIQIPWPAYGTLNSVPQHVTLREYSSYFSRDRGSPPAAILNLSDGGIVWLPQYSDISFVL
jgi:hypothetical protein